MTRRSGEPQSLGADDSGRSTAKQTEARPAPGFAAVSESYSENESRTSGASILRSASPPISRSNPTAAKASVSTPLLGEMAPTPGAPSLDAWMAWATTSRVGRSQDGTEPSSSALSANTRSAALYLTKSKPKESRQYEKTSA